MWERRGEDRSTEGFRLKMPGRGMCAHVATLACWLVAPSARVAKGEQMSLLVRRRSKDVARMMGEEMRLRRPHASQAFLRVCVQTGGAEQVQKRAGRARCVLVCGARWSATQSQSRCARRHCGQHPSWCEVYSSLCVLACVCLCASLEGFSHFTYDFWFRFDACMQGTLCMLCCV
jgi:hypothetical protein